MSWTKNFAQTSCENIRYKNTFIQNLYQIYKSRKIKITFSVQRNKNIRKSIAIIFFSSVFHKKYFSGKYIGLVLNLLRRSWILVSLQFYMFKNTCIIFPFLYILCLPYFMLLIHATNYCIVFIWRWAVLCLSQINFCSVLFWSLLIYVTINCQFFADYLMLLTQLL